LKGLDYSTGVSGPYGSEPLHDTCECGAGELACFPLNPNTGDCYIRGTGTNMIPIDGIMSLSRDLNILYLKLATVIVNINGHRY
jgi:hypothetical protein